MSESMHWADRIAQLVKERVEKDKLLQAVVKEKGYICYDEKTPSGNIHVGSGRGWVIFDCVAKALRKIGLKGRFILSSDDMDPFDKPSKELGEEWNKYLGMPFRDMPSPQKGYKNYADYYFSRVTEKFPEWGIEAELQSTGERYIDGSFNPQIKKILDNADKVKQIYMDLYGEDTPAAKKLPFNVKCPQCGKIATTIATEWNKEKEEIYFECKENVVKFAQGCGHKGWISPYNGNGKFPWKVEWPAKWPMMGVVYEIAGKDHFTKGGARTIANKIAVDVLGYPPPVPSDGYKTGKGYEFFTVGGAKMSTSKGTGMSFRGISEYAPAKMLRYLIVKSRVHAVLDFDPYNDNDLLLLYDRYDKTEKDYFEGKDELQKRVYELSHVGKIPTSCPPHIPLNTAAFTIQIALFDVDKALDILKGLDMVDKEASKEDIEAIKERLEFARRWVKDFASDQYKFEVATKVSEDVKKSLSEKQKEALTLLKVKLSAKDYGQKELYEEFYKIKEETNVEIKDFFEAAYLIIINKKRGPKLAGFILSLGKEKVIDLLNQAV
ncbi:lysine--tRNA ligase [Candidatus Woesearchaeota archaeon]|nr:lysine--tRNA ligase [Candidatus Woesearchaeota archaeon]